MALALIPVIGAALLIRTFMKLQAVDPGYDTRNVLAMAMSISGDRFQKTAGVAQLVTDGTDKLTALPGVETAASACLSISWGGRRATLLLREVADT
jgi:putative ABC transport system permease protein